MVEGGQREGVSDDPYEILGVRRDAERMEIRKRFQELARKYHPDKLNSQDNVTHFDIDAATNHFHKLSHAYHMLLDDITRHQFDAETRASEITETIIVNDTVLLTDCVLEDDGHYSYHCRCGGSYVIDKQQLTSDANSQQYIVECDTCSLHIQIIR